MSEENTSSVGTLIIVAIAAGLIGYVVGKPDSTQQQVNNEPAKHEEAKGPPVPHAVKWNGHWYAVYNDKLVSASDAQAVCVKSGGHLVVISSKSENEFVKGLAHSTLKDDNDYYIGLNRLSGKSWMWVNGEDYSKGLKKIMDLQLKKMSQCGFGKTIKESEGVGNGHQSPEALRLISFVNGNSPLRSGET